MFPEFVIMMDPFNRFLLCFFELLIRIAVVLPLKYFFGDRACILFVDIEIAVLLVHHICVLFLVGSFLSILEFLHNRVSTWLAFFS